MRCAACHSEATEEATYCPHCGARLEEPKSERDPLLGALLGERYRVLSRLGEGGLAVVYLASHEVLDRNVAIKILHPEISRSERVIDRFAEEARSASRIDHPNVISIFDFARDPRGFFYLVMEHIPGMDLAKVVEREGPFEIGRAIHVIAQIATALDRSHQLGQIHRDLKCENVMLTLRGNDPDFVKVVDFGLARTLDPETGKTTDEGVMGTPACMAPEQWLAHAADARTDIYALGVLAYEVLTGQIPYESENLAALSEAHLSAPVPLPSALRPGVPPAFDAFVTKAMAKAPKARFQSMQEALEALKEAWSSTRAIRSSMRTSTYAATVAAPPPATFESDLAPTLYQSELTDIVWDGPTLSEEIGRLYLLRAERFHGLVRALWGEIPPPELEEVLPAITEHEDALAELQTQLGELKTRIRREEDEAVETEARLRGELLDASLIDRSTWRSLEAVSPPGAEPVHDGSTIEEPAVSAPGADEADEANLTDAAFDTLDEGAPMRRAVAMQAAERRLASFARGRTRTRAILKEAVVDLIAELERQLAALQPIYAELNREIAQIVRQRREVRPYLLEFSKVDGAIRSYRGMLAALEAVEASERR